MACAIEVRTLSEGCVSVVGSNTESLQQLANPGISLRRLRVRQHAISGAQPYSAPVRKRSEVAPVLGRDEKPESLDRVTRLANRIALLTFAFAFAFITGILAAAKFGGGDAHVVVRASSLVPLAVAMVLATRIRRLRAELRLDPGRVQGRSEPDRAALPATRRGARAGPPIPRNSAARETAKRR
jgi:hypothetical protein